jgi:integrase
MNFAWFKAFLHGRSLRDRSLREPSKLRPSKLRPSKLLSRENALNQAKFNRRRNSAMRGQISRPTHIAGFFEFSVIIPWQSNATILIASGVNIASVSKRLSHAKIATTIGRYTHAIDSRDATAAGMLDDVFSKNRKRDI